MVHRLRFHSLPVPFLERSFLLEYNQLGSIQRLIDI